MLAGNPVHQRPAEHAAVGAGEARSLPAHDLIERDPVFVGKRCRHPGGDAHALGDRPGLGRVAVAGYPPLVHRDRHQPDVTALAEEPVEEEEDGARILAPPESATATVSPPDSIQRCSRIARFAFASKSRLKCCSQRCSPEYRWKRIASRRHLLHFMLSRSSFYHRAT